MDPSAVFREWDLDLSWQSPEDLSRRRMHVVLGHQGSGNVWEAREYKKAECSQHHFQDLQGNGIQGYLPHTELGLRESLYFQHPS
jgi:hypothetical protein